MHQVNDSRMPLLRTATGCRCRNTLDIIAITRVRRSRGTPWRKIEFQTCELRTYSSGDIAIADCGFRTEDCKAPQAKQGTAIELSSFQQTLDSPCDKL